MQADRYTKRLDSYQHLIIMLFATLGEFVSLRELEIGFLTAASRMNHFGMDYMVRRSTLSDANARRTPAFFEAVYNVLYARYKSRLSDSRPIKGLKRPLFVMDSTTISLFSQVFWGTGRNAINGQKKGGAKAHTVIRADEDVPVFVVISDAATSDHVLLSQMPIPPGSCITFDMGYVDYEAWKKFTDDDITYVTREKQNFPLKYFIGDSQNAIQIQIWVCLIAWLLMQVVKSQTTRKWSLSNMMVAARILLTSYVGLYDFLNAPEAQWMKIIRARQQEQTQGIQLSLFERGPVFENQKTLAYLSAISDDN